MADKLLTALFLALSIFAATYAHVNQGLRLELARAEERLLDERRVIGYTKYDSAEMKFVFMGRK